MATPKLVKMIGVTNIAIIFNIFLHFDLLFLPWLIGASVKKVENFNVEFDVCDNVLQQNFDVDADQVDAVSLVKLFCFSLLWSSPWQNSVYLLYVEKISKEFLKF